MPATRPVVIGNWKMNGLLADATARIDTLVAARRAAPGRGTLAVCPPATLLAALHARLAGSAILLGGQDCAPAASGAFTGDIAAPMLRDCGCELVIVGHSERRHGHGETDQVVRAKAEAALAAGLTAILCIGETEEQWLAGQTTAVLDRQLAASLPAGASAARLIVAYEPVWAIGTGRTPEILDIGRTHAHLRARVRDQVPGGADLRLLYGGSVKAANAAAILALADVDGVLVGGASLDALELIAIHQAGESARAGQSTSEAP